LRPSRGKNCEIWCDRNYKCSSNSKTFREPKRIGAGAAGDIAEAIEGLPETMQAIGFRLLSKNEAIEVYENLDSSVQQTLIEDFKRQDVLDIVDKMSPDDRARLFDELPAKVVRRLLSQMSSQERQATALLLGYEADTAGRIMTPEYIALKETWSISRALEHIRNRADMSETVYYLYVTDCARRLTGILSLRHLVMGQPEQTIGDIMTREVRFGANRYRPRRSRHSSFSATTFWPYPWWILSSD
jgi:magnesium transporter